MDNAASIMDDYIDVDALQSEAEKQITAFDINKDSFTQDAIKSKAQGISGAESYLTERKTNMQNVIGWYASQNEVLKRVLAASSQTDYAQTYNTKKATVEEIRKTVEEQRELEAIRQEQVKSLEHREDANFHTSWLGLQRPMKEGSQIGLFVAAGFFAILAILGGVYIYREYKSRGFPDMGFRGGKRRYSTK